MLLILGYLLGIATALLVAELSLRTREAVPVRRSETAAPSEELRRAVRETRNFLQYEGERQEETDD